MENIPHGLKEAIENDELVLFIGAGLSWDLKNTKGKPLGGWKEMVSSILSYLNKEDYITAEEQQSCEELGPIKALQRLENNKIDKRVIGHFVKGYFKLGKENNFSLQEKLYSLSTKIITTNYDRAFEIAFPELQEIKAYKTKDYELNKLKKDPIFLFKLHGCIEHIDSMVLFPSDYDKLYKSTGREAEHALYALRNLIFNKTFLFIGTGMGDPQITSFFEEIKRTQGIYNQEHFIITFEPLKESLNFLTPIKINDKKEIPGVIDQLLDIKKDADAKKSSEKKLLLEQLEASEKEKEALEKELNKEKDKNKSQALLLKREANNHFRLGLKHHQAEEYLEAAEEYKTASELKPEYSEPYNNWGIALVKLAKTKSGNKAEKLYTEAFEKYKLATTYKKDNHEAYNNWGVALRELAQTKSGNEAEELYTEASEKYKLATTYKKDLHQAYYNWGVALVELAKTKSGNEAEELYKEAFEKYKLATTYKKDKHQAYYNWGIALVKLAKTKSGNKAEELYTEAFEKYKLATTYKKDFHQAYDNWGLALVELAKTKSGNKAEELHKEAIEKYNEAIKHGGKSYNLACLYAIRNQKAEALKYLDIALSRNEVTINFVEERWKNLRNDPDFQHLLSRYKK
ncbi:SIR2 family protein [Alloprevotella tannerae]|uniref:SIR2 family protein n=1 Tax=Alloprevotella tannerae TaxID=76122 RepID=UPI0028E4ED64|nr:SIR2 family protein [Alloprevotella tannerae]